MGKIEADVFLTAIMPPIYATVFGILVEVRKKLGSSWLRALLQREGGPRILEHGGAGAGILACNQVLKAEWGEHERECRAVASNACRQLLHRSSLQQSALPGQSIYRQRNLPASST